MMHYTTIALYDDQWDYIQSNYIRLSKFVRDCLQQVMDADLNHQQMLKNQGQSNP